jgi:hypothetical protein
MIYIYIYIYIYIRGDQRGNLVYTSAFLPQAYTVTNNVNENTIIYKQLIRVLRNSTCAAGFRPQDNPWTAVCLL